MRKTRAKHWRKGSILWIVSISVALAGIMLAYTSYLDLKKREVEDRIWVIFGACGVILQIYGIYSGATVPLILGISVGLASVIGLGIFFLGLYGGADAKALIVLAVVLPYFQPRVGLYAIAPVIILTNGILLSMFLPGGLFLLNVTRLVRSQPIFEGFRDPAYRKILACLLGYKSAGKPRGFQFTIGSIAVNGGFLLVFVGVALSCLRVITRGEEEGEMETQTRKITA